MIRASSGASADNRSARASTTFCRTLPVTVSSSHARRTRARCSSGAGIAPETWTVGSGSVGQSGGVSARSTDRGAINATGPSTSKGNAPSTIGTAPVRSADCAVATS